MFRDVKRIALVTWCDCIGSNNYEDAASAPRPAFKESPLETLNVL